MESIIKEFWYGNINPQDCRIFNAPELKELQKYLFRHHEKLEPTLTPEQKKIFEALIDCRNDYESLAEAAIFSYGFRLGAQMIIDIFYGENSSK